LAAAPETLQTFEEQRPRLFSIAYRLLGSASEAEDTVQDTFLTEANCQQLYRRARLRVADDRPRFDASHEQGHRIADDEFLAAARSGDLTVLESLLAADVVAWADGGGKAAAARRPVHGAPRVARYLTGWMSRDVPGARVVVTEVNGQPGILGILDGQVLVAVLLDVVDHRVATVCAVANPDKLAFLAGQAL
jgi:hypothetical protein